MAFRIKGAAANSQFYDLRGRIVGVGARVKF